MPARMTKKYIRPFKCTHKTQKASMCPLGLRLTARFCAFMAFSKSLCKRDGKNSIECEGMIVYAFSYLLLVQL